MLFKKPACGVKPQSSSLLEEQVSSHLELCGLSGDPEVAKKRHGRR